MKVEQEKKKCYLAHEALKEKVHNDFEIFYFYSVSSQCFYLDS